MKAEPRHQTVSVARYLYENIHLLGFQKINRVINTIIRELVDNAQDECAKASIVPSLEVQILPKGNSVYTIRVKDNGPSIPVERVALIAGRALYGDKFMSNVASRGQQGLGLKGINMYSKKTTGKPLKIVSKCSDEEFTTLQLITIDIDKNEPVVVEKRSLTGDYFPEGHGFQVTAQVKGSYQKKGGASTIELIQRYSYLNPALEVYYKDESQEKVFKRVSSLLLPPGKATPRIPHHQQLGDLQVLLRSEDNFQKNIGDLLAQELYGQKTEYKLALDKVGIPWFTKAGEISDREVQDLHSVIKEVFKNLKPPSQGLNLLNEGIILAVTDNYRKHYDHVVSYKSPVTFFRQGLIQVELCAFYGGNLPLEGKIEVQRVANGSPLTYLTPSCAITRAIMDFGWKRYGVDQTEGQLPRGPLLLVVHVTGTKVPYTGPGKDAIATDQTIIDLIEEGLRVVGKGIKRFRIREELRASKDEKIKVITRTIPELVKVLSVGIGREVISKDRLIYVFSKIMDCLVLIDLGEGKLDVINGSKEICEFSIGVPNMKPSDYSVYRLEPIERRSLSVPTDYFIEGLSPDEYVLVSRKTWANLEI